MQNNPENSPSPELNKTESDFVFYYTQAALNRFKIRNLEEHINSADFDRFDSRNQAYVQIKNDNKEALNMHINHLRNTLLQSPIDELTKETLKSQCLQNVREITRQQIFTIKSESQKIGHNLLIARTTGDSKALEKVQDGFENISTTAVEFGKDVKGLAREYITGQAEVIFTMMHEQLTLPNGNLDLDRSIVMPFATKSDGNSTRGTLGDLRNGMKTLHSEGYLSRSVEELDAIGIEKTKEMRMQDSIENISQVFSEIDNDLAPQKSNAEYYAQQISHWTEDPTSQNAFDTANRILDSASEAGHSRADVLEKLPQDMLKNYQEMHKQFSPERAPDSGTSLGM